MKTKNKIDTMPVINVVIGNEIFTTSNALSKQNQISDIANIHAPSRTMLMMNGRNVSNDAIRQSIFSLNAFENLRNCRHWLRTWNNFFFSMIMLSSLRFIVFDIRIYSKICRVFGSNVEWTLITYYCLFKNSVYEKII